MALSDEDVLDGKKRAPTQLEGNDGIHWLVGEVRGIGADVFLFTQGGGRDVVTDWVSGTDRINLEDFDLANYREVMSHATRDGDDMVFDFGTAIVVVEDATRASFQHGDFIL